MSKHEFILQLIFFNSAFFWLKYTIISLKIREVHDQFSKHELLSWLTFLNAKIFLGVNTLFKKSRKLHYFLLNVDINLSLWMIFFKYAVCINTYTTILAKRKKMGGGLMRKQLERGRKKREGRE